MSKKEKSKQPKTPFVTDPPHPGFMVSGDQGLHVVAGTTFPEMSYGVDILWDALVRPLSIEEFRNLLATLLKVDDELKANGV